MPEPALPDKVVALDRALTTARVRHAFGGALALAYYAEPRATIDVDINLFVPTARFDEVSAALGSVGVAGAAAQDALDRDGQCRLWWATTPVDLFFAYHPLHKAMQRASRIVPFGDVQIPILAAEHLVVCKAMFARPKDWIDIEQVILSHPTLKRTEILGWVRGMLGPNDQRTRKLEGVLNGLLGSDAVDQARRENLQ